MRAQVETVFFLARPRSIYFHPGRRRAVTAASCCCCSLISFFSFDVILLGRCICYWLRLTLSMAFAFALSLSLSPFAFDDDGPCSQPRGGAGAQAHTLARARLTQWQPAVQNARRTDGVAPTPSSGRHRRPTDQASITLTRIRC